MSVAAAALGCAALMAWLTRRPAWQPLFNRLPPPLWCYLLPAVLTSIGWLPEDPAAAREVIAWLLPFALALLLLGADLHAVTRTGWKALAVAAAGAAGVAGGAVLAAVAVKPWLPVDGWKGAGALAGTWTGGSMNLTALQAVLDVPDAVFAPLLLVDALIAYSWMAVLLAIAPHQHRVDAWLRAAPSAEHGHAQARTRRNAPGRVLVALASAAALAVMARWIAARCPLVPAVPSPTAWTVLIVTTSALALSAWRPIRKLGSAAAPLGSFALLVVLAAIGAQARLSALRATPVWLAFGVIVLAAHAAALLIAGRSLRVPSAVLATASQANIGGVISAPMVAAAWQRSLVPMGLALATAGNAIGTYVGWAAAWAARALLGG